MPSFVMRPDGRLVERHAAAYLGDKAPSYAGDVLLKEGKDDARWRAAQKAVTRQHQLTPRDGARYWRLVEHLYGEMARHSAAPQTTHKAHAVPAERGLDKALGADLKQKLDEGTAHWVTVTEGPLEGRHLLIDGPRGDHGKVLAGHGIPRHVIEKLGAAHSTDVRHVATDHDPQSGAPLGQHGIKVGQTVTYQRGDGKKALTGVVEQVNGDTLTVRVKGSLVKVDAGHVVNRDGPGREATPKPPTANRWDFEAIPEDLRHYHFTEDHTRADVIQAHDHQWGWPVPLDTPTEPLGHLGPHGKIPVERQTLPNGTERYRIGTGLGWVDCQRDPETNTWRIWNDVRNDGARHRNAEVLTVKREGSAPPDAAELAALYRQVVAPYFLHGQIAPQDTPEHPDVLRNGHETRRGVWREVPLPRAHHFPQRESYHAYRFDRPNAAPIYVMTPQSMAWNRENGLRLYVGSTIHDLQPVTVPKDYLRAGQRTINHTRINEIAAGIWAAENRPDDPLAKIGRELTDREAGSTAISEELQPYGVGSVHFNDPSQSKRQRQQAMEAARTAFRSIHGVLDTSQMRPVNVRIGRFDRRMAKGVLAYYTANDHTLTLSDAKGYGPFFHEYGHALDFGLGRKVGAPKGQVSESTEGPWGALMAQLRSAGAHPTYIQGQHAKVAQYPLSAHALREDLRYVQNATELFARFFAEWTQEKLEQRGGVPEALRDPVTRERWRADEHRAAWREAVRLFEAALAHDGLLKSLLRWMNGVGRRDGVIGLRGPHRLTKAALADTSPDPAGPHWVTITTDGPLHGRHVLLEDGRIVGGAVPRFFHGKPLDELHGKHLRRHWATHQRAVKDAERYLAQIEKRIQPLAREYARLHRESQGPTLFRRIHEVTGGHLISSDPRHVGDLKGEFREGVPRHLKRARGGVPIDEVASMLDMDTRELLDAIAHDRRQVHNRTAKDFLTMAERDVKNGDEYRIMSDYLRGLKAEVGSYRRPAKPRGGGTAKSQALAVARHLLKSGPTRSEAKLVEELAEAIHNIWMGWAVHAAEHVDAATRKRWQPMFVSYDDLPEQEKQKDRIEAIALLDVVRDQGFTKSQGALRKGIISPWRTTMPEAVRILRTAGYTVRTSDTDSLDAGVQGHGHYATLSLVLGGAHGTVLGVEVGGDDGDAVGAISDVLKDHGVRPLEGPTSYVQAQPVMREMSARKPDVQKSHQHVGRHTNGRFVPSGHPDAVQGDLDRWRKGMQRIGFLDGPQTRVANTAPDGLDVVGQETPASPPRPFPFDVPNQVDAPTSMAASQASIRRREQQQRREAAVTSEERRQIRTRFGTVADQCTFARDKDGLYCYTHRARSKSYATVDAIPRDVVEFIGSTG